MSSVELFFLNAGLSYTLSKVAAYLLFPLIGFLLWVIIKKRIRRRGARAITLIVLCVGFFLGYFVQYPIYEGDFANSPFPVNEKSELDEIQTARLVVISIPNCPFCEESISRMIAFQERHPKVKIEYRLCVSDSSAKDAIASYVKMTAHKIPVLKAKSGKELEEIAEMSFPTFVLVTQSKKVKWSNDKFGVGALDEVVGTFEN